MADQLSRSPPILECRWGLVRIDGHGTVKDAKLYPGGARGCRMAENDPSGNHCQA